jgi:hypothetical protein
MVDCGLDIPSAQMIDAGLVSAGDVAQMQLELRQRVDSYLKAIAQARSHLVRPRTGRDEHRIESDVHRVS